MRHALQACCAYIFKQHTLGIGTSEFFMFSAESVRGKTHAFVHRFFDAMFVGQQIQIHGFGLE
jgi:hypothetical protein